jgi:hypothetical protein
MTGDDQVAQQGSAADSLAALRAAVREIESHAARGGWDAPARLFALVPTADLVQREPGLAARLGLEAGAVSGITPVEQEPLPTDQPLDQVLQRIVWPDAVVGAATVLERLLLPAAVEEQAPAAAGEVERFAAMHPDRVEVRVAAGVLRDGKGHCVLRLRSHDSDDQRVEGNDVVPGVLRLLAESLLPDSAGGRS